MLQVDPHLHLIEDSWLQATYLGSSSNVYGSEEDDVAAMEFLEKLEKDDEELKQSVISHIMKKFEKLPEVNPCICTCYQLVDKFLFTELLLSNVFHFKSMKLIGK